MQFDRLSMGSSKDLVKMAVREIEKQLLA